MSAEPQFPRRGQNMKNSSSKRHLRLVSDSVSVSSAKARPALVPGAAPKNRRMLIILGFLAIPFALGIILWLNILTAQGQYELLDLRAQEKSLIEKNEALVQEIEYDKAPQDLAVRASQLGLVATDVTTTLNLQTGQLSGTPVPAAKVEGQDHRKNLISPPALYDTEAYAKASERAAEQLKKERAEQKRKEEAARQKKEAEQKAQRQQHERQENAPPSASPSQQPAPHPSAPDANH
ncbi:hypothetical protein ACN08Z_02375 [Rothia sp. P7181]|uniref:hypothetical protein n=1 Tax=unclassified Rothia (in: high G+C Gram-positive bacteria) TaxID=2689056 RepID=UPI003AC54971